ncbi:tetratricopeptide repeat protein [Acidobacteriota bacterium]
MEKTGQLQTELGNYEEALETFKDLQKRMELADQEELEKLFGDDLPLFFDEIQYWISRNYLNSGQSERAFELWKGVIENRRSWGANFWNVWLWYIELNYRSGRTKTADQLVQEFLAVPYPDGKPQKGRIPFPDDFRPSLALYSGLSAMFLEIGNKKMALEMVERGRAMFSDDLSADLLYAYTVDEIGQYDKSKEFFRKLLDKQPENRMLYLRAIAHCQLQRDFEEIIRLCTKALEIWPDDDLLEFQIGSAYERLEKYELSVSHLERSIELNPTNMQALNWLGYSLADRNVRLEEALDYVTRAVDLDRENGAYLDSLGWVYFRLGRYDLAEKNLLESLKRIEEDATIHDHLGDLYITVDRIEEAVKAWKKAAELSEEQDRNRILLKLKAAEYLIEDGEFTQPPSEK